MTGPRDRGIGWVCIWAASVGLVACDARVNDDVGTPDSAPALRILAGAQRALGGEAVDRVQSIMADADVQGPGSTFRTTVWSARDGRARMEQTTGFRAVVDTTGGTRLDQDRDAAVPLEPMEIEMVRGHELHALTLMPMTRYGPPRAVTAGPWDGEPALQLTFLDTRGDTVTMAFAARDTLPLGLHLTGPDPDVRVRFLDWHRRDGVRLFRTAVFEQATDTYRYTYSEIAVNDVADRVFARPPPAGVRP